MDQVEGELDTLDELGIRQGVLAVRRNLAAKRDAEVAGGVAQEERLDGHAVLAVTRQGLGVLEELLGRVGGRGGLQASLLEHLTVVVQDVGLSVVGQSQNVSVHRHTLHHRSVVVGGLDAGGFHVGVERLKQAGQLLRTGGLRGEDAGRVRGNHTGLDLGPVVVEGGAVEGQGEVGILLLGRIDEGLPLGAVVVRGDPGVHLVDLVRASTTARAGASRAARTCEQGDGRGGRTECEVLGDSGAHAALLPCQGHRGSSDRVASL
ncbi:Uncharacterised protein [Mycobacteroides abscessus subsp. abscessus]|nr:Uncharacterised protein [Mycobacteroides abscessus subsp. abscessus]